SAHRGNVVALAGAGRAYTGEERGSQPIGLPLSIGIAGLEAVVLEEPVEFSGDRGEVADDGPVQVRPGLVAKLVEEPAAEEDVAEPLHPTLPDHAPETAGDHREVVLVT